MEEIKEPGGPLNPPELSAMHGGHHPGDGAATGETPGGRPKAQSGADPFTSRLSDEFFDELREKRGLGRKLTAVRGVALAAPDPIVEVALRKISAEFGRRSGEIEDRLASQYLSDVEAVTSRLNARPLPRMTRLLLTQRGVYVNLLAQAIQKVEGRRGNGHTHAAEPSREKETKSKPKSQVD